MKPRPLIALCLVCVVLVGGVAFMLVRQQRALDRLEQQLAALVPARASHPPAAIPSIADRPRSAPVVPAARAVAWSPVGDDADDTQPLANPQSAEARRLVEELQLSEPAWSMMLKLNAHWREVVEHAQRGEPQADPIERVAEMRERKLRRILGDEGYERYLEFERSAPGARATFQTREGTRYDAVEYE